MVNPNRFRELISVMTPEDQEIYQKKVLMSIDWREWRLNWSREVEAGFWRFQPGRRVVDAVRWEVEDGV